MKNQTLTVDRGQLDDHEYIIFFFDMSPVSPKIKEKSFLLYHKFKWNLLRADLCREHERWHFVHNTS